MAWDPEFEVAFKPKAVAVVGASRESAGWGDFVSALQRAQFPGSIYPINPRAAGEKIRGLTAYPNLVSVPEHIDLVMVSVPADAVPAVLEDCIAADARNIHIFTAGFRETGEEKGIRLEREIKEIAKRGGLRILGPNCMGLHVPAGRITTWDQFSPESGPVAFISQSGGHAGQFVGDGARFGLKFSKVISIGNTTVMDSIDFLEYLANDPETGIICMYLEGVSDGNKLTSMVRQINLTKPVVIWKGGLTQWGSKAVASHTGALGGEREVWDAFYRQTGAVRVDGLEELLDVTMTLQCLAPLPSSHIALMGGGGGNSVAGADVCTRAGLDLPTLADGTQAKLRTFIPPDGTIIRNPLDIGVVLRDVNLLLQALEPVAADPTIDSIIFALPLGLLVGGSAAGSLAAQGQQMTQEALRGEVEKQFQVVMDCLIKFDRENEQHKPIIIVLQPGLGPFIPGMRGRAQEMLLEEGIPVYFSLERAARAVGKVYQYHDFLRRVGREG
ncbi:MAG: CoA-binding protein [Chloroflexota bacterium]|nr:CoA-binding protein [Chloroflexota bacterium]